MRLLLLIAVQGEKECGIYGAECDKEVTRRFYSSPRRGMLSEWPVTMHETRSEQMIRFFNNPRASFEACSQIIKQCKDIYEAQAEDVPRAGLRWRRDLRNMDDEEIRRVSSKSFLPFCNHGLAGSANADFSFVIASQGKMTGAMGFRME
jgi:hypothetical protein